MQRSLEMVSGCRGSSARTPHTHRGSSARASRAGVLAACAAVLVVGCKSDLSQTLLERELRMQEDQIYQLQDELEAKCARLERVAGENASLRRQLGFSDGDPAAGSIRLAPTPAAGQPTTATPPLTIPGMGAAPGRLPAPKSAPATPGGGSAPGNIAPPTLEGVPPLPAEPLLPGAAIPSPGMSVVPTAATVPATADVDPAARPIAPGDSAAPGRQLSHEESLAEAGRITHLVFNQTRTACFDGDGDGTSDGIAIVIEPRDGDGRLVSAAGDVVLVVFDERGNQAARWEIPAAEAVTHFRRTSRNRGLHLVLRWPGPPPHSASLRLHATLTSFDGTAFETNCTVTAQPTGSGTDPRSNPPE